MVVERVGLPLTYYHFYTLMYSMRQKELKKIRAASILSSSMFEFPNPDKPEITNYKHHLILKLGQINSKLQYPNLK